MIDFTQYRHDHMILALQGMLGDDLVHAKDFLVGHPVDGGVQSGEPFIVSWKSATVPQPHDDAVHGYFLANEATIRALYIRSFRDEVLSNTDGRANVPTDAPAAVQTKAAQWIAYRAALRAMPEQPGFPHSVDWPARPE